LVFEPVEDALLFVVGSSFEFANQLSGGLLAWALRKARYERTRGRFRAFIVVQHFGKECCLVEETILVLRILPLRRLVLFECFLRLAEETEAIAKIGPHVGIVVSERNGLLVVGINR
jgi:hypothetical protein